MKTKINAEEVLLLFEDIKALLESLGTGLRECEDRFQCEESFNTVNNYINELLTGFRTEFIRKPEQEPVRKAPYFVVEFLGIYNRKVLRSQEGVTLNKNEERIFFMNRFYKTIKEKLSVDGVDHLNSRMKIHHHIYQYLFLNDSNLCKHLESEFADSALLVIDSIVDEILEERRRTPQLQFCFPNAPMKAGNRLIDNLSE